MRGGRGAGRFTYFNGAAARPDILLLPSAPLCGFTGRRVRLFRRATRVGHRLVSGRRRLSFRRRFGRPATATFGGIDRGWGDAVPRMTAARGVYDENGRPYLIDYVPFVRFCECVTYTVLLITSILCLVEETV